MKETYYTIRNRDCVNGYLKEIDILIDTKAELTLHHKDKWLEAEEHLAQAKEVFLNHIIEQLAKMQVCGACGSITSDPSTKHLFCVCPHELEGYDDYDYDEL